MSQIIGVKDIRDILQARIVVEMDDVLHRLDVNETPFFYFVSKLKKKETKNVKFEWNDKDVIANWSDITSITGANWGAGAATNGDFVVPDRTLFNTGDLLIVPTATAGPTTNVIVTAIAAGGGVTGTLTAQTVDGSTVDYSNLVGGGTDLIRIVSSADESGARYREPKATVANNNYNYIQIFRTALGLTEVQEVIELYDGKDRNEQRLEKSIEHARKIEQAFVFGTRYEQSTGLLAGNHPQWFTGGVYNTIGSAQIDTDANGTLTELEWISWVESALKYGSDMKMIFCAPIFASALTYWAMNKLQLVSQRETSYGMRITTYRHPVKGEVQIFVHEKLFEKAHGDVAMCIDLDNVAYRNLPGLDTKLYADIQNTEYTEIKDEMRTYAGLQLMLPTTHRILNGVTAYSA